MNSSARFQTLDQWLRWQEGLHPRTIDLGLERVARVAARLQCLQPAATVITVAGTNGKGSAVALLVAILMRAGYRVGSYTSPHLLRYNERVRLQGEPVADETLCAAFDRVDHARAGDSLTYFEFGTLAALDILRRQRLDVALLEVGLGGRLDAVNIVDGDAALVTSIGLDHTDWLGKDREAIGREKAGIFRAGRPAVCCDSQPPASLRAAADERGASWHCLGEDFKLVERGRGWHWQGGGRPYRDLPRPALAGAHQLANAAGVLMVLQLLEQRLPVDRSAIEAGLRWLRLPGRIERIAGTVEQVLDVSHNVAAALALVDTLRHAPVVGETHAVIGMMADKDIEAFVRALQPLVSRWYPVGLAVERAASAAQMEQRIAGVSDATAVTRCDSMAQVPERLRPRRGDRVLVCGSFYTVSEWLTLRPAFGQAQ